MPGPGGPHQHVPLPHPHLRAALAAGGETGLAAGDDEHLVGRGVGVVEGVDAVPPGVRAAAPREVLAGGRSGRAAR
ncbi:hypothetical protein [Deinococcus geothermalis]|uniref:hypothetical protein n=1 Tax=Deinococcus geothermalis TaxID=68909 RepID=UPI0012FA1E6C|nr:hypothetical protein [Deinococcus geothermalis]